MPFKDHFSTQAKDYSKYRPRYPQALFQYLASWVPEHDLAWDCATNGQAALPAPFRERIATDASEQIAEATPHEKVTYQVAPAEKTEIAAGSVDLITVAQALHWFEFDKFYTEARRVAKPEGLLAVWCYAFFECDPRVDPVVYDYYSKIVGPYWPPDRKLVEEKYETIPFPFKTISAPEFFMEDAWSFRDVIGSRNLFTQNTSKKTPKNPLIDFEPTLRRSGPCSGEV
jgi:SAM-dependent methyltransferase